MPSTSCDQTGPRALPGPCRITVKDVTAPGLARFRCPHPARRGQVGVAVASKSSGAAGMASCPRGGRARSLSASPTISTTAADVACSSWPPPWLHVYGGCARAASRGDMPHVGAHTTGTYDAVYSSPVRPASPRKLSAGSECARVRASSASCQSIEPVLNIISAVRLRRTGQAHHPSPLPRLAVRANGIVSHPPLTPKARRPRRCIVHVDSTARRTPLRTGPVSAFAARVSPPPGGRAMSTCPARSLFCHFLAIVSSSPASPDLAPRRRPPRKPSPRGAGPRKGRDRLRHSLARPQVVDRIARPVDPLTGSTSRLANTAGKPLEPLRPLCEASGRVCGPREVRRGAPPAAEPCAAQAAPGEEPFAFTLTGHIGGTVTTAAVQGDYAYVAVRPTLVVLDLSGAEIRQLGFTTLPTTPRAMAVSGNYAYFLPLERQGLVVVDISDPAQPAIVGQVAMAASGVSASTRRRAPGRVCVCCGPRHRPARGGCPHPAAPAVVKTLPAMALDVVVSGQYAYVTGNRELRVLNLANPANPVLSRQRRPRQAGLARPRSGSREAMPTLRDRKRQPGPARV